MDPILQGLQISILGILITFSALGVFILLMLVLLRLFPYKEEPAEEEAPEAGAPDSGEEEVTMIVEGTEDPGVIAAIAAAIAVVSQTQTKSGSLGDNLTAGRGAWWATNLAASRQSSSLRRK